MFNLFKFSLSFFLFTQLINYDFVEAKLSTTNSNALKYDDLLKLIEPGNASAPLPLNGTLKSMIEWRQCHKITGCSQWKTQENTAPRIVYDKYELWGYEYGKSVGRPTYDGLFITPFETSRLAPIILVDENGELSLKMEIGKWGYDSYHIHLNSMYHRESESFKGGYWDSNAFWIQYVSLPKDCDHFSGCLVGYEYDKGRVTFNDTVKFELQNIVLIENEIKMNFIGSDKTADSVLWKEAHWTIYGNILR